MKRFFLISLSIILFSCQNSENSKNYIEGYSLILGNEIEENFKYDVLNGRNAHEAGGKFFLKIEDLRNKKNYSDLNSWIQLLKIWEKISQELEVHSSIVELMSGLGENLLKEVQNRNQKKVGVLLDTFQLIGLNEIRRSTDKFKYKFKDVEIELLSKQYENDTNRIELKFLGVDSFSQHGLYFEGFKWFLEYKGDGVYSVVIPGKEINQSLEYQHWTFDSTLVKAIR